LEHLEKKIDLEAKKDSKIDEIYLTIIKDLKTQIGKLEEKVDNLIFENIALKENVARLDERIK
jgi:outer membrane murein-binding lipoprotein Lpp